MGLDMFLTKENRITHKVDELIYWRKANAIHRFFLENGEIVQDGVSAIISKEVIEDLLDKCNEVLEKAIVKEGKINVGRQFKDGEWIELTRDGKYIENVDEIESILPTQDGFFFGSTDYDEFYLEDIKWTKEQLEKVLKEVDFNQNEVVYDSSW